MNTTHEAVGSKRQTRERRKVIVLGLAAILVVGAALGTDALRSTTAGTAGTVSCPQFNPWTKAPYPTPTSGQDWTGCDLSNFNLKDFDFTGVTMANVTYYNTTCPSGTNSNGTKPDGTNPKKRNPENCDGEFL